MVEVPDLLQTLYTAEVVEADDSFVVEVPSRELDLGSVERGETVRVALLETAGDETGSGTNSAGRDRSVGEDAGGPPVSEGEVLEVTIESVGDQGDGIAKVGPGYVLIVPETEPGEQPTVRVEEVKGNVGFAEVID